MDVDTEKGPKWRCIPARDEGFAATEKADWRRFLVMAPSPFRVFELTVRNKGVTGAEWGSM
jgi:hypothetical protein